MSNVPPPNPFGFNDTQSANPYEVSSVQPSAMPSSDPETIRKYYIGHEASIKSIGTLYLLGSLLMILCTMLYFGMFVYGLVSQDPNAQQAAVPLAIASVFTGSMAALQIVCVYGLWKLRSWARILVTVFSCFGLLAIPIGTLINGYFIYLLQSEKANVIFSDAYQDVIRQTPHVKYRTSLITWIVLGLLVLFIVGMIALAFAGGAR